MIYLFTPYDKRASKEGLLFFKNSLSDSKISELVQDARKHQNYLERCERTAIFKPVIVFQTKLTDHNVPSKNGA